MARKPRQKTVAQRRANPALRSKLPASQLTPAQRAERARLQKVTAENKNPLYDPTTQLAGHSLIQAARDLADAAIKPKTDAYNRQLTSVTTQGTALASRAGDYYKQLATSEMGRIAGQKALGDLLNAQTANVGAASQAQFQQMSQAEQQREAADAALRGQGLGGDSASRVAGEIAAQQGTAATLQQGAANSAAQSGNSWANLSSAMAGARQLRGGEVQGQLLNRLATQQAQGRQQIADTEAQRGDLTSENLTKLRQQAYENLVTNQGLNIKQADLQAQVAGIQQRADAATSKTKLDTQKFKADQAYKKAQIDIKRGVDPVTGKPLPKSTSAADALNQWKLDYAKKHGHLPSTGTGGSTGAGGTKPATPVQQSTFRRDTSSALAVANALKGKNLDRHKAAAALTTPSKQFSKGLDPLTASVALDVAYDGHISQYNVDRLHKAGIAIGQLPWPTRRQWEAQGRRRPRRPASSMIPGFGQTA